MKHKILRTDSRNYRRFLGTLMNEGRLIKFIKIHTHTHTQTFRHLNKVKHTNNTIDNHRNCIDRTMHHEEKIYLNKNLKKWEIISLYSCSVLQQISTALC